MTKPTFAEGDWRKPERAKRAELMDRQIAFLDWLVDPERSGSQAAFAERLGVDPSTLTKWKKDPLFVKAWDKRLAEMNVSPERTQSLIDIAHQIAENSEAKDADRLKAVELYLKIVDKISPNRVVIEDNRNASDLTDEQLAEELRGQLRVLEGGAAADG